MNDHTKPRLIDELWQQSNNNYEEFFNTVIIECAKIAENHSRSYSDGQHSVGCSGAATAVRYYGQTAIHCQ